MIESVIDELISSFGKEKCEAKELVDKMNLYTKLMEHPLRLHKSPYEWALILLKNNKDFEAIEKHHLN
ncbi:hypothetical protein GLN3_13175 [Geobacillus lituanicus]|nr:hypothetical protein GLN3_13175 [Geobacillus lituanicus]